VSAALALFKSTLSPTPQVRKFEPITCTAPSIGTTSASTAGVTCPGPSEYTRQPPLKPLLDRRPSPSAKSSSTKFIGAGGSCAAMCEVDTGGAAAGGVLGAG
jgi:hypothetical protein